MLSRSLNVPLDGTQASGVQHAQRHAYPRFLTGALRSRFNPVVSHSEQLETIK
jgi:hypothetical protein